MAKKETLKGFNEMLFELVTDHSKLKEFLRYIACHEVHNVREALEGNEKKWEAEETNNFPTTWQTIMELFNSGFCKVEMSPQLSDGISAIYIAKDKTIRINPEHSFDEIVRSFAVEIAFAYIDNTGNKYSRQKDAFAAMCIAYIVSLRARILDDDSFLLKIPEHLQFDDPEKNEALFDRVILLSNRIISSKRL